MKLVTARQMQELDRQTIELDHISLGALMRRAAAALAAAAKEMLSPRSLVMVLAGPGKNGADAVLAANLLRRSGHRVDVLQFPLRRSPFRNRRTADRIFEGADLVIDGLFGTGLSRKVAGDFKLAIEALNRARSRHPDLRVLAADIPSGLNSDTGRSMGAVVAADETVTFGLPKVGLVQQSAVDFVGRLKVADIGLSPHRIASIKTHLEYWTEAEARRLVRPRKLGSFKNDYGHVLVIAGSVGLHGAAWIAAHGALAAGAGLVTLAVPRSIYEVVAAQCRQVMVTPLEDEGHGFLTSASWNDLQPLLAKKTAAAIGPGIGRAPATLELLTKAMAALRMPAVLDADALTLAAQRPKLLRSSRGQFICTPHPGEMARLAGSTSQKIQADRIEIASRFARKHQLVLALKGARTVVADPAGSVSVNSTGNPALASGGTGDVLTGIIAGLLAQGLAAGDATRLGVFVHGRAADRLTHEPIVVGLKVEELLKEIPKVINALGRDREAQS